MRVRWLRKALADLDEETKRAAGKDSAAAVALFAHIRARLDSLADFPASGRPGRIMQTRELLIDGYPFIVPYRVMDGKEVQILRVFQTSRKPPTS
ncbi:putative toxin Y4kP [Deltaproteobacteria bacterium]|nr:putative toxin Y4kP [Deltaproteobacteria bacterium]